MNINTCVWPPALGFIPQQVVPSPWAAKILNTIQVDSSRFTFSWAIASNTFQSTISSQPRKNNNAR